MISTNQNQYQPNPTIDLNSFIFQLDTMRIEFQRSLDKDRQSEMGQFLTSASISTLMAGMYAQLPSSINLVDPGAGIGSLSAAFIARAVQSNPRPKEIKGTVQKW